MLKIALCDDEQNIRSYLVSLIRRQNEECEITEYDSADALLTDSAEYDLLFLDIALKEAAFPDVTPGMEAPMNGMELARQIRARNTGSLPLIIFITGYEEYVYDAFDVDAFQYLVKPIEEQRFSQVFARAAGRIQTEKERQYKKLTVPYAGTTKIIPLENIYYMESRGHKIILHLKEATLEYYAKIGELESELRGLFCRIHKGYLVNLSYVEGYSRTQVTLANGDRLMISKYKYEDFVKAHLHFLQQP